MGYRLDGDKDIQGRYRTPAGHNIYTTGPWGSLTSIFFAAFPQRPLSSSCKGGSSGVAPEWAQTKEATRAASRCVNSRG